MLDSGADATILPVNVLQAAGDRYVERMQMRGVVGEAIEVRLYLLAVHVAGEVVHGIRAIGSDQVTDAVIGRDVLNQLRVTLDGPALTVMIE